MGWEDGGRFRREGTYVSLWLIYVDVWQKPTQYYKAIVLQLKINLKKKGCSFIKKKRSPLKLILLLTQSRIRLWKMSIP